jgi:hypothetical protein
MFGKVRAWLRGDDLRSEGAPTVNEDAQVHDNQTAAGAATDAAAQGATSQAGIVAVDGAATTAEGQPVEGAAATASETAQTGSAAATVDPQAEAAAQLVAIYKGLPGVVPALIGGTTVAEVQQSLEAAKQQYADIRAQLLAEQGLAVPAAHAGAGGKPVPSDPFEMIKLGVGGSK